MTNKIDKETLEALEGLIKKGLAIKTEYGYQLTPLGRMITDKLNEQERALN